MYTCLLYACLQNRQLPRALKLHDSMITEAGVEPDAKTYAVLTRGCVAAGSLDKVCCVGTSAGGAHVSTVPSEGLQIRLHEGRTSMACNE